MMIEKRMNGKVMCKAELEGEDIFFMSEVLPLRPEQVEEITPTAPGRVQWRRRLGSNSDEDDLVKEILKQKQRPPQADQERKKRKKKEREIPRIPKIAEQQRPLPPLPMLKRLRINRAKAHEIPSNKTN